MDLEFHQLELRYERLRKTSPEREKRLIASLSEVGQQVPVVVVAAGGDGGRFVLVDGYKRVRALMRLRQDAVRAVAWELPEAEALLLERLMRAADADGPLEQGWLLCELRDRFGLSIEELARRFDKSASWVSRRLALVAALPPEVQEQVRKGAIAAHAAMKFLVPLARANREGCLALCAAVAPLRPSTRQMQALYAAFAGGSAQTRALVLESPSLFLRAQDEAARAQPPRSAAQLVASDLALLGDVARRAHRRLREGALARLVAPEREEVRLACQQARADLERLFTRCDKELHDARPEHPDRDPQAA
jgi:ParB/RepB/Spo0J family partition protein